MTSLALVQPHHLQRRAVIYIRQSTEHQVNHNVESRKLQHAMREHALRLGWDEEQVDVVESDTGMTGRSTTGREAYRKLLADVALGDVGVVVSYESARLSRNCSDWYPLLDLCAVAGCLIADRDGVYDPSSTNGRLLLGMKGVLSELELHTLRGRLLAGARAKAERGELAQVLPTGFVRLEDGRVDKDPDSAVRQAIELVFSSFVELRSANQVVRLLLRKGLKVPRRHRNNEVVWRVPTRQHVTGILGNPAYAGAYVHGRTQTLAQPDGTVVTRRHREASQWRVVMKDRYPAYVSWETYEEIQRTLRDNHAEYTKHKTRGIPREGAAVLHGITYCGVCGYKMRVQYSPEARYICNYHQTQQPGSGVCQNLPAEEIDKAVVNAFFAALQPAELDLYSEALQAHQDQAKELVAAQQRELQRLQYEADLARRQYDRVDPDNRLVAGELERRWEAALRELRETEQRMCSEQQARDNVIALHVPQKLHESFSALGERLPKIWSSPLLHQAQRKALLRCLVDKVVLRRSDAAWETVRVRVVWRGGAVTAMDVPVPVATASRLSTMDQLRSRLLALKAEGLSDRDIAQTLTDEGFRSPRRNRVSPATVKRIRLQAGRTCDDQGPMLQDVPGALTVRQLAEALHVKPMWIYSRIRRGTIEVQRDASTRRYLFPDQPTVLKELEELKAGEVARVKIVSTQGASR